jgi:hypothetical protein
MGPRTTKVAGGGSREEDQGTGSIKFTGKSGLKHNGFSKADVLPSLGVTGLREMLQVQEPTSGENSS